MIGVSSTFCGQSSSQVDIMEHRCTTESPCVAPVRELRSHQGCTDEVSEGFDDVLGPTHSMLSGYLPPLGLGELHLTIPRRDLMQTGRNIMVTAGLVGGVKAILHEKETIYLSWR